MPTTALFSPPFSTTPISLMTAAAGEIFSEPKYGLLQVKNNNSLLEEVISKIGVEGPRLPPYRVMDYVRYFFYLGSGHEPRVTPLPAEQQRVDLYKYPSALIDLERPMLGADEHHKTGAKPNKIAETLVSLEQAKPANKRGALLPRAARSLAGRPVNPDVPEGSFGFDAVTRSSYPGASVWNDPANSTRPANKTHTEPYQFPLLDTQNPSQGERADMQRRGHADRLINDIITHMPNKGYLPQDGDHGPVLALAVQTAGWPANTALALLDSEGSHLATYTKSGNVEGIEHTIHLTRANNGEYLGRSDRSAGVSSQEQLFSLLLAEQPEDSQLGRGGDFRGSETRAGRIVHLREQIATLAEQHRPQLFNAILHASCSQADPGLPEAFKNPFMPFWSRPAASELVRKLHNETPNLSHARLEAFLQTTPLSEGEQRAYLATGSLPAAFTEARTKLEKTVGREQAQDAVDHPRFYNPYADTLMRQIAKQELSRLDRNLTILEPGQRLDLAVANKNDVILRNYGNGHYRAYSPINDEYIDVKQDTDSFFSAIASVLQPHEHRALGMQADTDVAGMRATFGKTSGPQRQATTSGPTTSAPATADVYDYGKGLVNNSAYKVLTNNGTHDHWRGIGRVKTKGGWPCTGTLLDTRSVASDANSPAYVLTAGHCISHTNGEVILNKPTKGVVIFNLFADTRGQRQAYKISKVSYSEVKSRDLALLKLEASLETLIQHGIKPFPLASTLPTEGSNVLNVGAPSGKTLQVAACTSEEGGPVINQPWVWPDMVMNGCTGVAPGSSGSPMLTRNLNTVFALVSVTTEGQGSSDRSESPGSSYGNDVTFLNRCFFDGVFDANAVGCDLAPVFSVTLPRRPLQHAKPTLDEQGNPVYPTWDLSFGIDKDHYRYKTTNDVQACQDPTSYGPALPSRNPYINATIGPEIGMNMLCIVGMSSGSALVDSRTARNALILAATLHKAGPAPTPELQIKKLGGRYHVNWLSMNNPQIENYLYKLGTPEATDCNDQNGYKAVLVRARAIPEQMLPLTICTITEDIAGQRSVPRGDILQ